MAGLALAGAAATVPAVGAMGYIAWRGVPELTREFLTRAPAAGFAGGGIGPAIAGTCILLLLTVAVALPLGLGAAIYVREYAPQGPGARAIRLAVAALAGVPSVVYGLFGLALFGIGLQLGPSLLTGGLTLGLLVLPMVIAAAEAALAAVPRSQREASLALGAGRWQTVWHAVLPLAAPGILTGVVLAVGRAAGETAPVLFTAAALYLPHWPRSLTERAMTLPTHLYAVATQVPGVPAGRQYATALVLLILVFVLNLAAIILRARFRRWRQPRKKEVVSLHDVHRPASPRPPGASESASAGGRTRRRG